VFLVLSCSSKRTETQTNDPEMPAFLYYKESLNAVEKQNYQEALALLDTAIFLKPEVSQFHFAKGQVYELKGDKYSAISGYEAALNYKSHFPDCWKKLAFLYAEYNRPDKAAQMLRYLTDYQPDSLQYELWLADAYLADDKPLLALERLNYFEKNGATSNETLRIRGLTYFTQGNYRDALTYLDQYVQKNPENFQAQKYLGIAAIKSNSLEKGISHLNQALRINPDDPEIYLYRARYFIYLDKIDTATEQYNLALKIDDQSSLVLLEVSKFYLTEGDTIQAGLLLNKAVAEDETCWECYKYLGIIADSQNKPTEAYDYLQKYISNIFFRDIQVEKLLEKLEYLKLKK
jgi:Tfp pilus assembly protein PilF